MEDKAVIRSAREYVDFEKEERSIEECDVIPTRQLLDDSNEGDLKEEMMKIVTFKIDELVRTFVVSRLEHLRGAEILHSSSMSCVEMNLCIDFLRINCFSV